MLLRFRSRVWHEVARLLWWVHDTSGRWAHRAADRRYVLNQRVLDRKYGFDDRGWF